jgi:hypothetical protein
MFTYSICDPLRKDPIEMGEIEKEKILEVFDRFPWQQFLNRIDNASSTEVHYSPSIEFVNKVNGHRVTLSIVDENDFYIFYSRPKRLSKWFGLIKDVDNNFSSDRGNRTINDAREAVTALLNGDFVTLEQRWG